MFKNIKLTGIALTSTLLVACGGGGGVADSGGGGGVSTLSFPVQSGYRSLQVNGMSRTFTISGSCTGTGSKTSAAANTATTFEGKAAFSSVSTLLMTVASPCNNIAQTYTTYIDSNYVGLGMNSVGVNYGVYLTAPLIPASVKVGDTGIIGTVTLY